MRFNRFLKNRCEVGREIKDVLSKRNQRAWIGNILEWLNYVGYKYEVFKKLKRKSELMKTLDISKNLSEPPARQKSLEEDLIPRSLGEIYWYISSLRILSPQDNCFFLWLSFLPQKTGRLNRITPTCSSWCIVWQFLSSLWSIFNIGP